MLSSKKCLQVPFAVVVKADNDDDDATDVRIETLAYSISGCLLSFSPAGK